jgi:hypothetical protein
MANAESNQPASPGSASYLFLRHPTEVDRLDLQHFALLEGLGTNYLAPVSEPAVILDVGSGTGR